MLSKQQQAIYRSPLAWMIARLPTHVPKTFGPHHRDIMQLPARGQAKLVSVWRGSGKTTVLRGTALWAIDTRRTKAVLVIRSAGRSASSEARAYYKAARLAGLGVELRASEAFLLIDDVPIWIRTAGAEVRGLQHTNAANEIVRPDLILIDDLETRQTARSKMQTDVLEAWLFADVMQTAGDDGATTLFAGTPITSNSLVSRAMNRQAPFDVWAAPAVWPILTPGTDNPTWDEHTEERVAAKRGGVPAITWATEYLLEPVPEGSVLFPKRFTRWEALEAGATVVGVDPSAGGADDTVAVAVRLVRDADGHPALYVQDCQAWKQAGIGLPRDIAEFARRNNATTISVEAVAGFAFLADEVAAEASPIRVVYEKPHLGKVDRALPATKWQSTRRMIFNPMLVGTNLDLEWHSFTVDGLTATGHDDHVDAAVWAMGLATSGWSVEPVAMAEAE